MTGLEQGLEQGPAVSGKEHALWLLEQLVPDTGINNLGIALRVEGQLKPEALAEALNITLGRYQVLRTVFTSTGGELAKGVLPPDRFQVPIEELDLPADALHDDRLEAELVRFVGRPLPLDGRPLVRAGLATRPDGDVFCLAVHHLVFDVTSAAIFMRTLVPVYDAVAAGRPVPPEALAEVSPAPEPQPSEADLGYWRESLRDLAPGGLDLWCGAPRANRPRLSGETATHTLSATGRAAVQQLQRQVRAPVAAVLLAAYYVLLASHGAGPDLVVGTPFDIRGQQPTHEIGYHVNVVPLRLRVDFADGFRSHARQIRDRFLAAMAHVEVSVDDLSAELPRTGSSWQTTLYRHVFNYLPQVGSEELTVDTMKARLLSVDHGYSKFDLELIAVPSKAEISFRYDSGVLSHADIVAMLHRYEAILVEATADPDRPVGEYAGWSEADREVVTAANRTAEQGVDPADPAVDEVADQATVADVVRGWASQAPDAPAVADGEELLSYGRLWRTASAVRAALAEAGVRTGDVVPVAAARAADLAAAALGSWLAGAACFPLGPGPGAGLGRQLERTGARLILAFPGAPAPDEAGLPVLRVPGGDLDPADPAEPGDPAGLGGHGRRPGPDDCDRPAWLFADTADAEPPAPVTVSHRGIMTMVRHFARELGAEPGTGTLASAAPASFGSLLELFLPLSTGGLIVAAPASGWAGGPDLGAVINRHDVRIVPVPPGTLPRALESAGEWPDVLRIVAQGEDLPPALARSLVAAGAELHSVHGAPQTGGWAMSSPVGPDGSGLTCGRPVTGIQASVRAPDGRELPVGVRGELCLAGAGTSTGDLRTGVLARWRPDGTVERLGPLGERVTIAGQPVDLGDVDAALRDHHGVAAALTVAVRPPGQDTALVSFVVPEFAVPEFALPEFAVPEGDPQSTDLAQAARDHARDRLPDAAVPARVSCLEVLPRRPDGRLDRDALLRLARAQGVGDPQPDDAESRLVQDLIELWQRLLRKDVTAQTGFFAAGGHSLLAARLAQDIEELTGIPVALADIFDHPTPAGLAARLARTPPD